MNPHSILHPLRTAIIMLAAAPLIQAVTVTSDRVVLRPHETCTLRAASLAPFHGATRGRTWTWAVEGLRNGTLQPMPGGAGVQFRAPLVHSTRQVRVWATDAAGETAMVELTIRPADDLPPSLHAIVHQLAEPVLGPGWDLPGMEAFSGNPPFMFYDARRLDADPRVLAALDEASGALLGGRYLLVDEGQLWTIDGAGSKTPVGLRGEVLPGVPVPGLPLPALEGEGHRGMDLPLQILGVAARGGRAVALVRVREASGGRPAHALCNLRAGGILAPLAALDEVDDHLVRIAPGALSALYPSCLVMDDHGTSLLGTEGGMILSVSSHGAIGHVAGRGTAPGENPDDNRSRDGLRVAAQFGPIKDLTLDPATGALFALEGNAIRRITPAGEVTTLLGSTDLGKEGIRAGGFVPPRPGRPVPPGVNCFQSPARLQFHQDRLLVADTGNHAVQVFDLRTRELVVLCGQPSEGFTRLGPLGAFATGAAAAHAAAIAAPDCLAVSDGACIVGALDGLFRLDLPSDAFTSASGSATLKVVERQVPPAAAPRGSGTPRLEGVPASLEAGASVELTAVHSGRVPGAWRFSVLGGGSIESLAHDRFRYTAPADGGGRVVHILAEEETKDIRSGASSFTTRIRILPRAAGAMATFSAGAAEPGAR